MTQHDPDLTLIFQALSDPTRRAMLAQIGAGQVSASALAGPTGLALPTVMRHLAVLEHAALISTTKTGRIRLCRARPETLTATTDWLSRQRRLWEARTDRLEAFAATLIKEKQMTIDPRLDLVLTRELNASREVLYMCWTTPAHLMQWFVPKPHKVIACALDVRPGGKCNTTFDIDGTVMENQGVYLEVIPNEKLVFTDTYTEGWKPSPEPFMTAILTFEDIGGGRTRYTAVARHRSEDAAKRHADMGFQDGWGTVADQLETYAQGLT